eukprot:gene12789-12917_t
MAPIVWVVVLGDFGRSPRMQYHTHSLSQHGYQALFQLLAMLWLMLIKLPTPQAILMQNPPAIPSMLVCWMAAKRHGASWIIDWHNFAYSIMQLKYAKHGWLISLAKTFEKLMGRQAQQHFCVTAAMKQFLESEFGVSAVVLYDRPPTQIYDKAAATTENEDIYPDVVFIITGRGPDRDKYIKRLRQLLLHKVAFCSLWLEPEDYPLMLGAADLGVCLHTSSSGLDLPMKVVDMYGSGLPVCAVDYECIDELVVAGKTGLLFQDAQELAQQLLQLFKHFPNSIHGKLAGMHKEVLREHSTWRWKDNWDKVAAPVVAAEVDSHCGRLKRVRLQAKKHR